MSQSETNHSTETSDVSNTFNSSTEEIESESKFISLARSLSLTRSFGSSEEKETNEEETDNGSDTTEPFDGNLSPFEQTISTFNTDTTRSDLLLDPNVPQRVFITGETDSTTTDSDIKDFPKMTLRMFVHDTLNIVVTAAIAAFFTVIFTLVMDATFSSSFYNTLMTFVGKYADLQMNVMTTVMTKINTFTHFTVVSLVALFTTLVTLFCSINYTMFLSHKRENETDTNTFTTFLLTKTFTMTPMKKLLLITSGLVFFGVYFGKF